MRYRALAVLVLLSLSGCSVRGSDVRKLRYGMTPGEVASALGARAPLDWLARGRGGSLRRETLKDLVLVYEGGRLAHAAYDREIKDDVPSAEAALAHGIPLEFKAFPEGWAWKPEPPKEEGRSCLGCMTCGCLFLGDLRTGQEEMAWKLDRGMTEAQVRSVLGPPQEIQEEGRERIWLYPCPRSGTAGWFALGLKEGRLDSLLHVSGEKGRIPGERRRILPPAASSARPSIPLRPDP